MAELHIMAIVVLSSFDILMVIFIIHSITFITHFNMNLKDFEEYLIENGRKDAIEVKKRLKEIHQSHLDIIG